ncbi:MULTISPECIES: hypothetical protein [Rahnella]|jgi:hypothetical protein|uniref:Uncharacterized protein n=1 Tax=Rahnella contaminans TaxID=2703882 RepID=A0A6M2B7K1_9GAMM|nr:MULTISPECIES: hypothetical protein [Rahnella]KAB8305984.1 hypothetical protein EH227_22110 [Rouxiella chamberiensis]MCS3425589.1 hypothetical protein [Rahnella sp. BIGb0603]MDF1896054.1 hypothetical protein [Rahnella contaminans]NGX89088.1 hypothetical protein [Rahnella contaminans]
MPVLIRGDSQMIVLERSYSPATLARRFEVIDEIRFNNIDMLVIYDEKIPFIAIAEAQTRTDNRGENRHHVVATLELARRENSDEMLEVRQFWEDDKAFQVEGVVVNSGMRDYRLATLLYETLVVKKHLTLMSDNDHYTGGRALWKRLAQDSAGLLVFILDTEKGQFYPYDGSKMRYDGVSIPESAIWSSHPDQTHWPVVLIAQNNKRLSALSAR